MDDSTKTNKTTQYPPWKKGKKWLKKSYYNDFFIKTQF